MTWANRITIFRILCVPVFIVLMLYYAESLQAGVPNEALRVAAFWVFVIAAISDGVDGFLARYCNQQTELGAILDPLADKMLVVGSLLLLTIVALPDFPRFPIWFTILMISRDLVSVVLATVIHALKKHLVVHPHWTGKFCTFFQFAAILMFLLKYPFFYWACVAGGVFAVASGIIHLRDGVRQLS